MTLRVLDTFPELRPTLNIEQGSSFLNVVFHDDQKTARMFLQGIGASAQHWIYTEVDSRKPFCKDTAMQFGVGAQHGKSSFSLKTWSGGEGQLQLGSYTDNISAKLL